MGNTIETVIEVFAKGALRDPFPQVPVRGGNDPRVDADRARVAEPLDFLSSSTRSSFT